MPLIYHNIESQGFSLNERDDLIQAVQARHLSLASAATLKAILELLNAGSGSRGPHLVLSDDGVEVHPDIKDPDTGQTLKFKPENEELRKSIIRITFDPPVRLCFNVNQFRSGQHLQTEKRLNRHGQIFVMAVFIRIKKG